MRLFALTVLSFLSVSAAAQYAKTPRVTPIQGADIVCSNAEADLQISINSDNGKIWINPLSSKQNAADEVQGPVYQGIHSPERYTGEVLGEVILADAPAIYIAIILREVNGQAQMEYSAYEQGNSKKWLKVILSDCRLGR